MHKGDVWRLDYVARVEGEGGLDLVISGANVEEARLRIFEPPRFFEGFLEGRKFDEVPDITARICGICPISYQMAACGAIEGAGICGRTWLKRRSAPGSRRAGDGNGCGQVRQHVGAATIVGG